MGVCVPKTEAVNVRPAGNSPPRFAGFADLVDAAVPDGGFLVSVLRAYFDESGTHDGSPVMAFAGYIIGKPQASRFRKQWADILAKASEGKPQPLEYFHMREAGGNPPTGIFKGFTYDEVDALARELIKITRQRTVIGISVVFNRADYDELIAERHGMPCAYAFGAYAVMMRIRRWAEKNNIDRQFAYFFEAGNEDEAEARDFIKWITGSPSIKAHLRYYSDTWIPKAEAPTLQSADMLAWHTVKHFANMAAGKPMRRDLDALARADHDFVAEYKREHLEQLADAFVADGRLPANESFRDRTRVKTS